MNLNTLMRIFIVSGVIGVGISYADVYLFHIILIVLGIVAGLKMKQSGFKLSYPKHSGKYELIFFLMIIWYGLSIFWAPDKIYALKYLFYLGCGTVVVSVIIWSTMEKKNFDLLFHALATVFLIELLLSLLESFTAFRLPISPFSPWAVHFGKTINREMGIENLARITDVQPPTGFHWNTNNLAIAMVLILPFFLCSKKVSVKGIGALAISVIIVLAASRAVFLGLLVIFCLYLLIIKKKIVTLALIWAFILSIIWGMFQWSESEDPRLNEVANTIEALSLYIKGDLDVGGSLEWRRELVDNGLDALKKTNGLGVGSGGSVAVQESLGGVEGRFTSMHNFWVEILVEGGVVFFILFAAWYGAIVYNLYKIIQSTRSGDLKYYASSLLLAMLGFIPAAIAASSTIYFFPMWIMFGLSISVIYQFRNSTMINKNQLQFIK